MDRLLARADEVRVIDNLDPFYDKTTNLRRMRDRVSFVQASILDKDALREAMSGTDAVVHLAARAGVRPSIAYPAAYVETNVAGTLSVLESMRELGVGRFVFGSSSSVYGSTAAPAKESDPVYQTLSPYAATKLAGEQLAYAYSHLYQIQVACLRFFTVYGPRQRPDLAIAKFIRLISEGDAIEQYGDASSSRDYTYVDDIVTGIVATLDLQDLAFEVINLGAGRTTSLSQLIAIIADRLGVPVKVVQVAGQQGDVPFTQADTSKAKALLGYSPEVSLPDGIGNYVLESTRITD